MGLMQHSPRRSHKKRSCGPLGASGRTLREKRLVERARIPLDGSFSFSKIQKFHFLKFLILFWKECSEMFWYFLYLYIGVTNSAWIGDQLCADW